MGYKVDEGVFGDGGCVPQLLLPVKHFPGFVKHELISFLWGGTDGGPDFVLGKENLSQQFGTRLKIVQIEFR